MKKRGGCDIEAIGINYTVYKAEKPKHSMKISSKLDNEELLGGETLMEEQETAIPNKKKVVDDTGGTGKTIINPAGQVVLKDVSCRAKAWEILAIVGPSGAGKSSLLEILSGRLTPQSASIFVDQKPIEKARFKKLSGYVTQEDTLFPLLTVEETLTFSSKLRGLRRRRVDLEEEESESESETQLIRSRVKSLIQELGLGHVAGSRVGNDDGIRGISGGERRRVSIGVEVIHDPKVLFLDEPTSGLDSNSALQIIDMVKTMAETRGRTIILSIHQPGFRILKLFNSILLLANGSVLHHGTLDQLGVQLSLMGLQLPPVLQVNILEFAIDSIQTLTQHQHQHQSCSKLLPSTLTPQNKNNTSGGKCTLQQLFRQSNFTDDEDISDPPIGFANSRLQETIILTHRFSKNIYRTRELFACRTLQMLLAGLLLGSIFYGLKDDLVGAEERVGLFAFILTFLLSSTTEALPIFLQEREILMKETSCGSYRVSSYAIANALVYLPFLLILAILFTIPLYWLVGLNQSFMAFFHFLLLIWLILYTANSVVVCFSTLVPNFIVGNSVICGVMGSFFLFSGYFVSKNGMPSYWVFMHYISLFKYPFEGLLINEFSSGEGKCLEYMFGKCMVSGEDLLREEGYGEQSIWRNVVIMVCFILVYRFVSYVILRCRCSQS